LTSLVVKFNFDNNIPDSNGKLKLSIRDLSL